MSRGPVIVVDDEEDIRVSVQQSLELRGFEVTAFARADRALDRIDGTFPGVIVSDIRMPKMDGLQFLAAVMERDPDQPVILVTGHGDVPLAVEALGKGAFDFIEKPFATDRLVEAVDRAAERRRIALDLRAMPQPGDAGDPLEAILIGTGPAISALRARVRGVAASGLDAVILGETGTGKDLVARALHRLSPRRERAFVAINLAALPEASIETELFGHVAGAFPGALRARTGRLEHARGGTVYLDGLGATTLALQAKLLRVIEERAIEPLGTSEPVPIDARFIASSKDDPEQLVAEGRLRDDLLYRLNQVTLRLPPLRDRPEDIPRLFRHFASEAAERAGLSLPEIPAERLLAAAAQPWPGNVRELQSAANRFALGLDDHEVQPLAGHATLAERVDLFERGVIAAMLDSQDGNLRATYESLGLSRKTLYEKMQKHGLRRGSGDD